MTTLIKTASLTGFPQLVRELGGDPDALLQAFNVAPSLLESGSNVMPYRTVIAVLEHAADCLNCPDFGLQLSKRQSIHILGPLAVIAQNSTTVGEALREVAEYMHIYSPGIRLELDTQTDPLRPHLLFEICLPAIPRIRQTMELSLGVGQNVMQLLYGKGFRAEFVLFRNSTFMPQDRYQRFFGTRAYFGQGCNALVLRPEHLTQVIDQHNSQLHEAMLEYISSHSANNSMDIRSRVEDTVKRLLPTKRCTLPLIAQHLGLHERSLQRRLEDHNLLFEDVVDLVRLELADLYLTESEMPMAQVAGLLGYAEQSSFNRACRRWHGITPRARRQQLQGLVG